MIRAGIDRETLFDALPQPAPAGVVFILFGQPDWDYPDWLRRALRVAIPPFTPLESRTIVCRRLGWSMDDPAAAAASDIVHERSGGNPLSLFYNLLLIEGLGTDPAEVVAGIATVTLFGAAPHVEYDRLLEDLESQLPAPQGSRSLKREMLACVAVATAAVTEERLCTAFSGDALTPRQARDYLTSLRPVVVERDPGCFWLFHDDFRRYAEQRTTVEERQAAHRRFAAALNAGWRDDELGSLAEHCWLGGNYELLADLPSERNLDVWFEMASRRDVVDMHRLALAAAFRMRDDIRVMRNALAAALAAEAADLPWDLGDGPPVEMGLAGWSFVAPPRGVDFVALRQRARALHAAADGCQSDATLAAEIASRFLVPSELLLEVDDQGHHELEKYTEALTHWFLRSGRPTEVLPVLRDEDLGGAAIVAVGQTFCREHDASILDEWTTILAGVDEFLDREIIGAAVEHLVAGRALATARIARALLGTVGIGSKVRRDAGVLLSLVEEGRIHTNVADIDTDICLYQRGIMNPLDWREFFFHGFVTTASGSQLELSVCELPRRISSSSGGEHERPSLTRLARFFWRSGCAAGLAMRHGDLLTVGELESIVRPLTGEGGPELEPIHQHTFANSARVFLPLMARAIRHWPVLCESMRALLMDLSKAHLATPSARLYGSLEALWVLAPDAWRSLARQAHAVTLMPHTGPEERAEWFQYWLSSGQERGVAAPDGFVGRSVTARIGVPQKRDPAALAAHLISKEAESGQAADRIRRLADLLIQLNGEPEGERAAYRHLPEVLASALIVNPGLFEWGFTRCVVERSIGEPFGSLPSDVAVRWLEARTMLTSDELMALWHWVAAAPGSLDPDSAGVEVARLIVERLTQLGATRDSDQVGEWFRFVQPPHPPAYDASHEEVERTPREANSPPKMEDVTPRWFSAWWGEENNRSLRKFISSGGDDAWGEICDHLARNIVQSTTSFAEDFQLVAQGICDLRQGLPRQEAIELALGYLSAKLRFQAAPPLAGEVATNSRGTLDVLIGLLARGLDVGDVETVRRTMRSLAALVVRPGTRECVVREMQVRLRSEDAAIVQSALCILRRADELTDAVRDNVRRLEHHPDAWCRVVVCSILRTEPVWSPARRVVTGAGVIAPGAAEPVRTELGAEYYSGTSSVREVYVRKLAALVDIDEETLRSELETELRGLPARSERPLGWRRQRGPSLTAERVAEAAGRLASRIASRVPASVVPALLAVVARFDPWLVLAAPVKSPTPDWIEFCRAEMRVEGAHQSYLLRALGLVSDKALHGAVAPSREQLAELLCRRLFPVAPPEYGWVAEPWQVVRPPRMRLDGFVPLAFRNSLFTQLQRDRFDLVPAFGLALFRDLSFESSDGPHWVHPELGPVLMAAHGESVAEADGVAHPRMDWWTGWFASPRWLASLLEVLDTTKLVRFWRNQTSPRRRDERSASSTVEYSMVELSEDLTAASR